MKMKFLTRRNLYDYAVCFSLLALVMSAIHLPYWLTLTLMMVLPLVNIFAISWAFRGKGTVTIESGDSMLPDQSGAVAAAEWKADVQVAKAHCSRESNAAVASMIEYTTRLDGVTGISDKARAQLTIGTIATIAACAAVHKFDSEKDRSVFMTDVARIIMHSVHTKYIERIAAEDDA